MKMLDTKDVCENVFRGERVFSPNTRTIYGGELMAQALMAATKTVPDGFKSHSLHCYFHDRASIDAPNDYHVIRFRDSRCFSHRLVEAFPLNMSKSVGISPFFRMDCSFKVPEEDPGHFVATIPKVPAVDDVLSNHSFIQNLPPNDLSPITRGFVQQFLTFDRHSPMEVRCCEPECLFQLKANRTGRLHFWMRLKERPSVALLPYRDALLSYFSDAVLLWAAFTEPRNIKYLVTLSQTIWFHNHDVCPGPDEWLLLETKASYVGHALTLSYGAMWNNEGCLLASAAQQGLMRTERVLAPSHALDEQTGG